MPEGLCPGQPLYRNNDQEMERLLSRPSAERKIPISMSLRPTPDGFELSSGAVAVSMVIEHQQAEKPQRDNIVRQLTKLGGTIYSCREVTLAADFNYFIPSSQLAELRRLLVAKLTERALSLLPSKQSGPSEPLDHTKMPAYSQPHLYNIANREACRFYGVAAPTAYELRPATDAVLMQCRHCVRYALGYCVKHGGERPLWKEPLYLRLGDGRRFRLEFDCRNCQMNVYASAR
jgi:putative protease